MKPSTKSDPIPVRFDGPEHDGLKALRTETGLNMGEIIRRACRFSFPKFLSGEVKIGKVNPISVVSHKGRRPAATEVRK